MAQSSLPAQALFCPQVFAEMYGGFASGKIAPKGDRMVRGKTTIDAVIKAIVG